MQTIKRCCCHHKRRLRNGFIQVQYSIWSVKKVDINRTPRDFNGVTTKRLKRFRPVNYFRKSIGSDKNQQWRCSPPNLKRIGCHFLLNFNCWKSPEFLCDWRAAGGVTSAIFTQKRQTKLQPTEPETNSKRLQLNQVFHFSCCRMDIQTNRLTNQVDQQRYKILHRIWITWSGYRRIGWHVIQCHPWSYPSHSSTTPWTHFFLCYPSITVLQIQFHLAFSNQLTLIGNLLANGHRRLDWNSQWVNC